MRDAIQRKYDLIIRQTDFGNGTETSDEKSDKRMSNEEIQLSTKGINKHGKLFLPLNYSHAHTKGGRPCKVS